MRPDPSFLDDLNQARRAAEAWVDNTLGPYVALKRSIETVAQKSCWWVRDITLSNTMWGNRAPVLDHPRSGVHALGGGIGQGLAMGIGAALASASHVLQRKAVVLTGDGGFMLNLGELACAVQERANVMIVLMNDARYGVIRNIQDALYGSRHCYVDLVNPNFQTLCDSLQVPYWRLNEPGQATPVLQQAWAIDGPAVVEVDMAAWGPFAVKFAGPPQKAK